MANRPFDETVKIIQIYDVLGGSGIDRKRKITKNFTLGEYVDATFLVDSERFDNQGNHIFNEMPVDRRIIKVNQIVRDYLKKPVTLKAVYRSPLWEQYKDRAGGRDIHTHAKATDLSGEGLTEMIETSIKEKNELYRTLIQNGVTSFGLYDWGVHLDVDFRKSDGTDRFWDNRKKKAETVGVVLGVITGIALIVYVVKRIFKL